MRFCTFLVEKDVHNRLVRLADNLEVADLRENKLRGAAATDHRCAVGPIELRDYVLEEDKAIEVDVSQLPENGAGDIIVLRRLIILL